MDKKEITHVKIVKDHLMKRIVSRPFKYYMRGGGLTFAVVALSNLFTTFFDPDRRQFMAQHPQMYWMGLMGKSGYFGLLWPSFYMTAYQDPYSAFIYGGGVEKAAKELEKIANEME